VTSKARTAAGEKPAGLPFLVGFIDDILSHQLRRFTQSYRVSYWTLSITLPAAS
jgi:hypothetical protein